MIVSGWKTGAFNIKTGSGYGIRIKAIDRDLNFMPDWQSVTLQLETGLKIEVNLSKAFWGKCPELRNKWIGKWIVEKGLAPWPKGNPLQMKLEAIGVRMFRLSSISDR